MKEDIATRDETQQLNVNINNPFLSEPYNNGQQAFYLSFIATKKYLGESAVCDFDNLL